MYKCIMVHPIDPPPPTCVDPERGQEVRTPMKNHKNRVFPSNTGPDPLKFSKLPSQHTSELSMLGHHRHTSKTPFKWPAFSGIRILSLLKKQKQKKTTSVRHQFWQNCLDPRMPHVMGTVVSIIECDPFT